MGIPSRSYEGCGPGLSPNFIVANGGSAPVLSTICGRLKQIQIPGYLVKRYILQNRENPCRDLGFRQELSGVALIGINDSFDQSVSYHINLFEIHEFNISDILEDGLGFH